MLDSRGRGRAELGALAAILVLAAGFRLWALASVPPGLHHDEAIYGYGALRVLNGERPIWFAAGGGREPLFMYLLAPSIALLGTTAFAIRLVAALVGIATVAASYGLLRLLFGRAVALLAAALLATSYWPVHENRLAFRANTLPLFLALAFLGLVWGLRGGGWRGFLLGGIALGLTAYTYFPSRLVPLLVLGWLGGEWLLQPALRRHRRGLALYLGLGTLLAAPLLLYILAHPSETNQRVGEASVFSQREPLKSLAASVVRTLGIFSLQGDPATRYNLDARPIFDPLTSVLFYAGVALALWRLRQPACRLALLWLAVMLLPSALSTESPHFVRSLGLLPILFAFPALAAVALADWLRRRWPALPPPLLPAAATLALALYAAATARLYFGEWAPRHTTALALLDDTARAGAWLATQDRPPGETTMLSVNPYEPRELVAGFLTAAARRGPDGRYPGMDDLGFVVFDGRRGLVLPPGPTRYLFPASARPPQGAVEAALPDATELASAPPLDGKPAFVALSATRAAPLPACATPPRFGDLLHLRGAEVAPRQSGGAEITLDWGVRASLPEPLVAALRLLDEEGEEWGRRDEGANLTEARRPGEILRAWYTLPVQPGAPPGRYRVAVAVTTAAERRPLPLAPGEGCGERGRGDAWLLPPLDLPAGPRPSADDLPRPALALEAGPALRLLGVSFDRDDLRPGERLEVALYWEAQAAPGQSYHLTAELFDSAGQRVASATRPVGGRYPAQRWPQGAVVQDRVALLLGAGAAPGPLELRLRLANASGAPVPFVPGGTSGVGVEDGEARLRGPRALAVPRRFDAPTVAHPLRLRLGDAIELLGHGPLPDAATPGGLLALTLYWHALGVPPADRIVFVHLLAPDGHIVAQQDRPPVEGTRPTSGWLAGEFLEDSYQLRLPTDLAAGAYSLALGLYDPLTGAREPVRDAAGIPQGDHVLLRNVVVVRP